MEPTNTEIAAIRGGIVAGNLDGKEGRGLSPGEMRMLDVFGDLKFAEVNNFPKDATENYRLSAKATGPSCVPSDDSLDKKIDAVYFHAQRVEQIDDKSGEIRAWIRVVLIDDKGEGYVFNSNTVARDLLRIIAAFGNRPWNPPVSVIPRKTKSKRNAGHFFSLEPA